MVLDDGDLLADQLFDVLEIRKLVEIAEADGKPAPARAACAADTVDVGLGDVRQVVVDDERQVADVDAARGDVGGDEDADLAALEALERLDARGLALVAVDRHRLDALAAELLDHAVGPVLGRGEDQDGLLVAPGEKPREQTPLVGLVHLVDALFDRVDGRGLRRHLDADRPIQDLLRQLRDLLRHRRREEQRLPLFGQAVDDLADVVDEAHVEHPVGLVEDEGLDVREVDIALIAEVVEPARRRDEDVDAALERLDLRRLPDAAEDHGASDRQILAVKLEVLLDLQRQLARRRQDQRADRLVLLVDAALEPLEDGHCEGRGLAGAGLRAADQVAPLEDRPDRRRLDRRGLLIAHLVDRPKKLGQKV